MITILSDDEQRKAVVAGTRDGFTVTHYRRRGDGSWVYDHAAFSEWPLHLVLNSACGVVNRL